MAGTTLRGIGEEASAEDPEPAAERATAPLGSLGTPEAALGAAASPAPTSERKLRSLDDLPGERTGRVGMPDAAPSPSSSSTSTPATAGQTPAPGTRDPSRVAYGTMIGHDIHHLQARLATPAEPEVGGRETSLGHDVHLPAVLGDGHAAAVSEPVAAPPIAAPGAPPADGISLPVLAASGSAEPIDFSGGDHSFFDTEPLNDEYEPENPRGKLYTRLAVAGAVVAMVLVVVIAWVRSHSSEDSANNAEPAVTAPAVAKPREPAPVPTPSARNLEPPTSTIPSSIPSALPAPSVPELPVAAPPSPPPPPPARVRMREVAKVEPPKPQPPKAEAAKAAEPKSAASKITAAKIAAPAPAAAAVPRRSVAPAERPPAPAAAPVAKAVTPTVRPVKREPPAPARDAVKPPAAAAAKPSKPAGKHGKTKYDPDGTLPLSFD
jgi:hypothetical protein